MGIEKNRDVTSLGSKEEKKSPGSPRSMVGKTISNACMCLQRPGWLYDIEDPRANEKLWPL